jgi:two-component system chemotaxis sensor kinase CheA
VDPELRRRLLAAFQAELDERRRELEAAALALDREGEPALRAILRGAHGLKGAARAASLPAIEAACHALEGALAPGAATGIGAADRELLSAFLDALADAARRLAGGRPLEEGPLPALTGRLREAAAAHGAGAPGPAAAADGAAARPPGTGVPAPAPPRPGEAAVRVHAARLDTLLAHSADLLALRGAAAAADTLGPCRAAFEVLGRELAAARPALRAALRGTGRDAAGRRAAAALARVPARLAAVERELDRAADALEARRRRLAAALGSLDRELLGLRMVPFAEACLGLERAAADAARAAGRDATLAVSGGEVEVDRALVETLREALLHLARNAAVHGIEPPTERSARGKPRAGTIRVAARVAGEELEVRVEDDGAGLDLAAVRAAAARRGLSPPATPAEAEALVLRPGFSTAPEVTLHAGRGIGLDAVRAAVEGVHGNLRLRFAPGRGATARLRVPLTLAVVRTLGVRAGGRRFRFLAGQVRRVTRVEAEALRAAHGRELLLLPDGEAIGVSSLVDILGVDAPAPARGARPPAVVLEAGDAAHAFVVDEVEGDADAVLQPLGERLRRVRHVFGAARLPDGGVALVLHGPDLVAGAAARAGAGLREALAPAPHRRRPRILLADDSVTTRALERSILEGAGYDVVAATDGEEARGLLAGTEVDLVLSDVDMPRLDGFGLTRAIRASPPTRALPVVLLTALASEPDRQRGLEAGANAYLVKGAFDQKGLLDTIAALVQKGRP